MKIAYILRGSGISGGQRVVHEHCQRLHERGHETGIHFLMPEQAFWLAHDYPLVDEEWLKGADVVVATSWPTAWWLHEFETSAAKAYLVQGRESLFLDHSQARMASEAEWTYRLPLHVVTIAPWIQGALKEDYGREVDFVRNGVGDGFNPDVEPLAHEAAHVLLVEGSGHSMAKDIFQQAPRVIEALKQRLEDVEVWAFTWHDAYRDLLAPHVDKVFYQPEQELIPRIYASADVMFKASRFEGAPCPIVEAMACGTPPVVMLERNPVNGTYYGAGDIQQGETGVVLPYGMTGEAVELLHALLTDDDEREAMRQNGMDYVQENLQWEDSIDRLARIYEQAAKEASPWGRAQKAEALWWVGYVRDELGSPTFSEFRGHRRQQLKDALRKFGYFRDQNYHELTPGNWLDAGSGPLSMLHGQGHLKVDAVDPLMAQYAQQLATVCQLGTRDNVTYQARRMEDAGGAYDGVWCWNVLDHTADWRAALMTLVEALKDGGELYLMTHCRPPERRDLHHTQAYSAEDVLNLLTENGMRLTYVKTGRQIGTLLPELYVKAVKV